MYNCGGHGEIWHTEEKRTMCVTSKDPVLMQTYPCSDPGDERRLTEGMRSIRDTIVGIIGSEALRVIV